MRKTLLSLAVAGAMATAASSASALTYNFSSCLSGCSGSVASIASLTMNNIAGGVSFSLTNTAPGSAFIGGFYMNGPSGTFTNTGTQTINSSPWVQTPSSSSNTSLNGYQWSVNFPPPPGGAAGDLFLPGETASWNILGAGLTVASFTNPARMMIHLQNIPTGFGMDDSAKLAPAVPEPETYAMFMAGLGLMGLVARRRQARRAEEALPV